MTRLILFLILSVFVARAFWRAVDGIIEGITGRPPGSRPPQKSASMVRDPVCGLMVEKDPELSAVYKGQTYYFCSKADRDKFMKVPEKYVGGRRQIAPRP